MMSLFKFCENRKIIPFKIFKQKHVLFYIALNIEQDQSG